jgi:hypothetical protein
MYCSKCRKEQRGTPAFCRSCGSQIGLSKGHKRSLNLERIKVVAGVLFTIGLVLALSLGMRIEPASTSDEQKVQVHGMGDLYGIIIGIGDYAYAEDLYIPDDGAKQINKQLEDIWGNQTHLKLLLNKNAGRDDIEEAMNWLASQEDADDTVLFYFSGHGNEDYIAPYDWLPDSWSNDISAMLLDGWLDCLDSGKIIVVLDSCRSGAYAEKLVKNGRVIITCCAANEDSYANNDLSDYVIKAFSNPEKTDVNTDSQISAEELYSYILGQNIPDQHPQLFDGDASELVLVSMEQK